MSGEFARAVRASKALKGHMKPGLQALKAPDKARIQSSDARRLSGSIDIDSSLQADFPTEPRWDYAVGHAPSPREADTAHWIEVHPCTDGEVKVIEAKVRWLRRWLKEGAPTLAALRATFVWVSSGSTGLSPRAPARRKLAQLSVVVAGSRYTVN